MLFLVYSFLFYMFFSVKIIIISECFFSLLVENVKTFPTWPCAVGEIIPGNRLLSEGQKINRVKLIAFF